MSELKLSILIGAESKAWLADLTHQLDRMEKLSTAKIVEDTETEEAPKKKRGRPPKKKEVSDDEFDDMEETSVKDADFDGGTEEEEVVEEEESSSEFPESEDEEEEKPKKRFKKPGSPAPIASVKIDIKQVNEAAQKLLGSEIDRGVSREDGIKTVKRVLKKRFDVDSIRELTADQYKDAILALKPKGETK